MSSIPNLYKPNSSKNKLQNVYPYDSFRPGNINENQIRGKSSSPSTKFNMQKDILKSMKGNNFQNNNFNSYNTGGFKFNDTVKYINFFLKFNKNFKEKLNEEIKNMKLEVNKKNKEIHSMKIQFVKLDDENKKNIRILEEVIIEANRNRKKMETVKYSAEDLEHEIKKILTYATPSDRLLSKLMEVKFIFYF